jgi:hypothetical protein
MSKACAPITGSRIRINLFDRAFELAGSGACKNVTDLIKRLDHDGCESRQIQGPLLRKQLAGLIEEAKQRSRQPILKTRNGRRRDR